MMKKICIILYVSILFASCEKLFPDEKLKLERMDYTGKELRTDGYYYYHWASYNSPIENNTHVMFLFRNGIILSAHSYSSIDLRDVEKKMILEYDIIRKYKSGWGVFMVDRKEIICEQWSTSVGGGLPVYEWKGKILNDTTIKEDNYVYHFRQFSPKPDSTNNFIK